MEWLVSGVYFIKSSGNYLLAVNYGKLKVMAEVTSVYPIQSGDTLYPVRDAMYLVNGNKRRSVKVINAVKYSSFAWSYTVNELDKDEREDELPE